MSQWKQIKRHLRYFWRAKNISQIKEPFIHSFTKNVIEANEPFPFFESIEQLRQTLKQDNRPLEIHDFGAGAAENPTYKTTIGENAKKSLSIKLTAQLLSRLTNWLQPKTMVELGTSLGIATLYQAMSSPKGQMYSIEGCPNTAIVAREAVAKLDVRNITIQHGNFDYLLPQLLQQIKNLDYIFVDGNHREEPTIAYFEQCLPYVHQDSILVFHDIRWSDEMANAWKYIQNHKSVKSTVEVYDIGIVFFNNTITTKKHYSILPKRLKPFVFW